MRSGLLPTFEHAARFALRRRGFTSRAVPTFLARLHAYDSPGRGTLPTFVVLHGIGSASTSFAPTLLALRRHARRVVALDLPGHGFSDPPSAKLTPATLFRSVEEALAQLTPEPVVLVGNSLGGALSLLYALRHAPKVQALVLLSPACARVTEEEWRALLDAFRVNSTLEAWRLLRRLYHRTPWYIPAFAPSFRDVLKRRAVRDMLDSATLDDMPRPEHLAKLPMPLLLLWGQSERLLPESSLPYLQRHLPAHAVIERPLGFGHCPHVDDPRRLAARIVSFAEDAKLTNGSTGAAR